MVSPGCEQRRQRGDRRVDERRRDHDPDVTGRAEQLDEARRAESAPVMPSAASSVDRGGVDVVADALVAGLLEPPHHVGAHPSEADHPELHAGTAWHVACEWMPATLDRDLAGRRGGPRRLHRMLDEMLGAGRLDAPAPSRLPGWTVGHVLTHLARNADSMVRVLGAAEAGSSWTATRAATPGATARSTHGCRPPGR